MFKFKFTNKTHVSSFFSEDWKVQSKDNTKMCAIISVLKTSCSHLLTYLFTSGVAQWSECRSLAAKLSLIFTWSMADMWQLRGQSVRYGSANQANSAFHFLWVGKWVVIHVITEVETIKRQTRAAYGCLDAGSKSLRRGLRLRLIGCTPALFVTQNRRRSCSCILWRCISVMPLPLSFHLLAYLLVVARSGGHKHPVVQRPVLPAVHRSSSGPAGVRKHRDRFQSDRSRRTDSVQRLRHRRHGRFHFSGAEKRLARVSIWPWNRPSRHQVDVA